MPYTASAVKHLFAARNAIPRVSMIYDDLRKNVNMEHISGKYRTTEIIEIRKPTNDHE